MPKGAGRSRLVVADAGVDQDVVAWRLHEIALNAEHEPGFRIEKRRLEPGTVLGQKLARQRREELQRVEERRLLLDDAQDAAAADLDLGWHG